MQIELIRSLFKLIYLSAAQINSPVGAFDDAVFVGFVNDVSDFFIRLQMGVALNAAEKLNAILGDVRDFVSEVALHNFFKKTIPLRDYRFSHRYLAAQII